MGEERDTWALVAYPSPPSGARAVLIKEKIGDSYLEK